MERAPLVSVITIFLDEERFLADAIESVVAQTYPNWELLLCDDGSTDGSPAIAQAWAARMPDRIRYLTHPGRENRGMSATRNLGIEHARGDCIAFLDGDDALLPGKLERQLAVLRAHPDAVMACARSLYWHSWTGEGADAGLDRLARAVGPPGRTISGASVLERILRDSTEAITTCSVLIRRDAVLRAGGFEARFRGLFEDQAFFSKLLAAERIVVMDECLDMYRQHPDSCCAVATQTMDVVHARRAEFLDWFAGWLDEHDAPASVRRTVALERRLHRHPKWIERRRRIREGAQSLSGSLVSRGFAIARHMLPAPLRRRLWDRFGGDRREEQRVGQSARAARARNGAGPGAGTPTP